MSAGEDKRQVLVSLARESEGESRRRNKPPERKRIIPEQSGPIQIRSRREPAREIADEETERKQSFSGSTDSSQGQKVENAKTGRRKGFVAKRNNFRNLKKGKTPRGRTK